MRATRSTRPRGPAVQGVYENPERVWLGVTVRVKGMDDRRAFGKQPCKWACLGRRLPRAFARAHAAPAHACGALRSSFALSGACRRTNVRA